MASVFKLLLALQLLLARPASIKWILLATRNFHSPLASGRFPHCPFVTDHHWFTLLWLIARWLTIIDDPTMTAQWLTIIDDPTVTVIARWLIIIDDPTVTLWWLIIIIVPNVTVILIPSPTKLRRDIVTLPSVLPSFRLSIRPSVTSLWTL